MTVPQAHAALKLAPRDDVASRVEPNLTRRQLVLLMESHLLSAPPTIIDLLPLVARKVEMVAQDSLHPARVHFAYTQSGELIAGWNLEEHNDGSYWSYHNYIIQEKIQEQTLRQASQLAEQARARHCQDALKYFQPSLKPQAKAPPAPPPPPPKPDPKAPGFVLKRPRL